MPVISRKAFRTFWETHSDAESALSDFYRKLTRVSAADLVGLRMTFPGADLVGDCVVFNVGGNKFRVIAHVDFKIGIAFIRAVLSHAEYDKDKWMSDC
jgi:mRNA interferase HigB